MQKMNTWKSWVPILEAEFEKFLAEAPFPSEAHRIDHIHRVFRHCRNLGVLLNADMVVLVAGSYLHDLGRHHIQDVAHGDLSAELAKPILDKIKFPKEKIDSTLHAIRVHDVTYHNEDRHSIESKILFDADKLDSFGTIGALRNILVHYNKKSIDYILSELELKWNGLALDKTRKYAEEDYEFIKKFFIKLKNELV